MKLLVSAFACSPFHGSEPGIGWSFVEALAAKHELYIITEKEEFADDINRHLAAHPELRRRMHFYFVPRIRWHALEQLWPPSYYWTYRRWCKDALLVARHIHRSVGVDLVHQLTITGFREPGYLWRLNLPFVWGPIAGMGRLPPRFLRKLGLYGSLYFVGYNILNSLQERFLPRPKLAAHVAGKGLIAATSANRDGALKHWGCPSTILSSVTVPADPISEIRYRAAGEPLRIVWSGLLIPRKALNLGLESLAFLPKDLNWELHVLGDGPRRASWQRLADRLGIRERCRFHGRKLREEALRLMEAGHVMLITSLRDTTAAVTIEALAMGLPVVCFDHCGFDEAVTDACGIKIAPIAPKQAVRDIASALEKLARNEHLRQSLARGALTRAWYFSWQRRLDVLEDVYRATLAEFATASGPTGTRSSAGRNRQAGLPAES